MATPSEPDKLRQGEDKLYTFKPFRVPKYQIKFTNTQNLSDIENMVWYTPAALYLWGKFTDTNLSEIISRKNIKVLWYQFDRPIFKHFGTGWDSLLWAAKEEEWPELVDSILETVQLDLDEKIVYQYAMQNIQILDPIAMDRQKILTPDKLPLVNVSAFAVLSNTGQMAFNNKPVPLGEKPGMSLFEPSPVHTKAASMLFKGDEPLNQEEAFARYKRIMGTLEKAAYDAESTKQWDNYVKTQQGFEK